MERQIKIIPCIYGGKPAEAAKAYDHSGADAVGYYDEKITAETVKEIAKDIPAVYKILEEGSIKAEKKAAQTLAEMKRAMKINYFEDKELIAEQAARFSSEADA